ncbi:MAG TPA: TetR/AcrR family transcriptional regulator [Polyangiaceae bacterium]|nr:TetR/AcrR family transcriptional regulator [Polyangiaceae bacterium]
MASKALKSKNKLSKPKREPLSRERIELTALALIERDGLAQFSQRSLARELQVEAMSLYHWHSSRLALLNALLDRIFSDNELYAGDDPIAELRHLAWTFRAVGLRYPKFFGHFVLQHRFNTETTLTLLERMTSACLRIARDEHDMALLFRTFVHFLMGALLDETSGYAVGPGAENPPDAQAMRDRFPHVLLLAPHNEASHHEENFRFGLELVLKSLEQHCGK